MSDPKHLFEEIEEDLQRQKIDALWKRYGNFVIALALVIVLATAATVSWKSHRVRLEQRITEGLLTALGDMPTDKAKQIKALESFAKTYEEASQAVLAKLQAAAIAAKDGQTEKAIALYDELAKDEKVEPVFRQLADVLAVQTQLDTAEPAALQARLQPMLSDSIWRYSAKELSAHLYVKAGDKENARKLFGEIVQDSAVAPGTMVKRAEDMLRLLAEGT